MGLKYLIKASPIANYGKAIRGAPREVIFNRQLLLSCVLYAMSAIPASKLFTNSVFSSTMLTLAVPAWDQGSASVVPSLPGFQKHFGISSGTDAKQIRNFITIIYPGYAVGAGLSFFLNDRIGRLWSFRVYILVWTLGQLVACFSPGLAGLYSARIISGLGIGALTVTGPMSIVELAPAEIRGLLTAWFNVAMGISLVCSIFCVLGVYQHISTSKLQFQVVWFSPCIYMALLILASFFLCESPRWLFMVDRHDEAARVLVRLRGLPATHPRVQLELREIEDSIRREKELYHSDGLAGIIKETFTVPSNLRRVQQSLVSYGLAQLSGANSITSYFVPILSLMGLGGGPTRSMFLSGMYGLSKLFFTLIASFFFIDALGRRKSLFVGTFLQLISDVYVGVYIKYKQESSVSDSASQGAIAFIFIHAFGYAVGKHCARCSLAQSNNAQAFSSSHMSSVLNSGQTAFDPSVVRFPPASIGSSSTHSKAACHLYSPRPITGELSSSLPGGASSQ